MLRWRLDEHRCRNFYDKYSKTIGWPAASARLTMVFVFPIGASQLFEVHFEQMPGFARTFIVTPLAGAGYAVVFAGRALREMFQPPFEIKDSAVQVAGEGVGALGGATAAHQSFWDNGPRS